MTARQNTDKIRSEASLANLRANAGKGRPKGALNKSTKLAKDAIAQAAETLGGAERIVAWAQEDPQNERTFWGSIYPKLLPLQVTGEDGGPVELALSNWFDGRGA